MRNLCGMVLHSKVLLETNGRLHTGCDVILVAVLGEERFGSATAPPITMDSIMFLLYHFDTCTLSMGTQESA